MTEAPRSYPANESDLCDGITEENRHDEVTVSSVKWRTKYREIFNENKNLRAQLEELQSRVPAQAKREPFVVSDEDWQRALDCAMECLRPEFTPPHDISRIEMDNAMQHAFGILSLKYEGRRGSSLPSTESK